MTPSLVAGCPNIGDSLALSGGSWSASYPLTNLQSRAPQPARTTGLATSQTTFTGSFAGLADTRTRVVALLGHNLRTHTPTGGTGAYQGDAIARLRVNATSNISARLAPDAILASTNLAGLVAALQDAPDAPDGSWLTATSSTSDTDVRVSFPTPATAPLTGTSSTTAQQFSVLVRKVGSGTNPTAKIYLYEGGSQKAVSSSFSVSSATGVLWSFAWNASLLGTASGASVECRVEGTASATATVEVGAVSWICNPTVSYDSGFNNVLLPRSLEWDVRLDLAWVLPSELNAVELRVDFEDASNTAGYLEAWRLLAGPAVSFTYDMKYGWSVQWVDPSEKTRSIGGTIWADVRPRYRRAKFMYSTLSETEALDFIADAIDRRKGATGDLYWIPKPDDTGQYHNLNIYGVQQDIGELVCNTWAGGEARWERQFFIEESR